ncbi:MAG TPA: EAL domain-containing protein [Bacilli bacterium]|nr:EAL domain-containing protein [Bacilli bacterium]
MDVPRIKTSSLGIKVIRGGILYLLLVFGAVSFLELGRSIDLFHLPWSDKPNEEVILLRAIVMHSLLLSFLFIRHLFSGLGVFNTVHRRRLHYAYSWLLGLSALGLTFKYFDSPFLNTMNQLVQWFGWTGLFAFAYILYLLLKVYHHIEERLHSETKLSESFYQQLVTDPLTDLPNRVLFQRHLAEALEDTRQHHEQLAVLFLDLDRFKLINDSLGHTAGDTLLQRVVTRLKECLPSGQLVYRLGGDEFVCILTGLNDSEQEPIARAREITDALRQPFVIDGHELFITTSIGISRYPYDGEDWETLFKNADTAMYRAKEQGRNHWQFYDAHMHELSFERLALEKDMRKALERGGEDFILHYQPQVNIHNGKIHGLEALVRWNHPERGMVSPGQFIPLAEETQLIIPLGEYVLREACRQNKAWQDMGYPPVRVSVNLSAHQFNQPNLVAIVKQILHETGLNPKYLDLEITESMTMNNVEHAIATMYELAALGIQISIDDFGTSYSSLNYLKKFPIHTLKIDQSFVRDISTDPDDAAIATAIIVLAHSLHLNVIAEGVETMEQLSFLREQDCDEMQGYLYSRPLPPQEIESFLQEERDLLNLESFVTWKQ